MVAALRWWLFVCVLSIPLVQSAVYDVNLVIESSTSEEAQQLLSIAKLAVLEASVDLGSDSLRLNVFEYDNDPALASKYALESGQNSSVLALIPSGPQAVVDSISALGRWFDLPVVSFDASNTSNPASVDSTFVSLHPHISFINHALSALFTKYNWTQIGILHRNTLDDALLARAIAGIPGITATLSRMPPDALDNFLPQFQFLVKFSISVVVIVDSDPVQTGVLLRAAEQANFFALDRAFIIISNDPTRLPDYLPLGTLILSVDEAMPTNTTLFNTKIQNLDPSLYPGAGPGSSVYPGHLLAYDSIRLLGQALANAGPGAATRQSVLSSLQTDVFSGYSGIINFDPSTGFVVVGNGRISVALDAQSSIETTMTFDGNLVTINEPVWPGNTTQAPEDDVTFVTLAAVMTLDFPQLPSVGSSNFRSAFAYAVDHINRDPDILPENVRLSILLLTSEDAPSIIRDTVPLGGYGIAGVVGAIQSANSILVQNVVSRFGIPQISPGSTNPSLSVKTVFPTFFRTCPPDNFQGAAIIELAQLWGWTEISIISSTDAYGIGIASELTSEASKKGITILLSIAVDPLKEDLRSEMTQLKEQNIRILIMAHANPQIVGREMYKADFSPAAVVGTDTMVPADLEVFWGATNISVPLSFVNGWVGLLPSGGNGPVFDKYIADLAANPPVDNPLPLIETGYFLVVSTIDAIRVYADAIRRVILAGGVATHGPTMIDALKATDLMGLTGQITFNKDNDRVGPYDIKNWVNGVQKISSRYHSINETLVKYFDIVWPDGTTNIPLSSLPRDQDWLKWSSVGGIILAVFAALGMIMCFFMLTVVFFQRHSQVITSATWEFLIMMLIGATLGFGSVFTWIGYPRPYICALRIWLPPMALILIIAPLLAKTWRLHRIFSLKDWKLSPVTLWHLSLITASIILVQIIICVLWISLGTIQPVLVDSRSDRRISFALCGSNRIGRVMSYITFGYIGLLLVVGAYLAFRVRKLPRDFNESRWIGFSIYNTLLFAGIVLILGYSLGQLPVTILILICVCSIAIAAGASCFMMLPKLWELLRHPERRSASNPTPTGSAKYDTSIALRTPGNSMRSDRVTSIRNESAHNERPRAASDYSLAPGEKTHAQRDAAKKRRRHKKTKANGKEEELEVIEPTSGIADTSPNPAATTAMRKNGKSKASSSGNSSNSSRTPSPPIITAKPSPSPVRASKREPTPPSSSGTSLNTPSDSSSEPSESSSSSN